MAISVGKKDKFIVIENPEKSLIASEASSLFFQTILNLEFSRQNIIFDENLIP